MGKNMHTGVQIMLRNSMKSFAITDIKVNRLPGGLKADIKLQDFISFADGIPYPDILSDKKTTEVSANVTQPVVIVFETDTTVKKGTYHLEITISTSLGECKANVTLVVHKAVVPEPKDSDFCHEYMFDPIGYFLYGDELKETEFERPYYNYQRYSEGWWELMKVFAVNHKVLRSNVLYLGCISILLKDAGSKRISENEWHLDFSLVDRLIDIFMEHGSVKKIALGTFLPGQTGAIIRSYDYDGSFCNYKIFGEDGDAERWANFLYTKVYEHFIEKGIIDLLNVHLLDEPKNTEYWLWAKNILNKCMPGIPTCEPIYLREISHALKDDCDIPVPRTDIYDDEPCFYADRVKEGKEFWIYSCCFPEEQWWLTKFLDAPQRYSRMMSWACFSSGTSGYLHWGFNHWRVDLYSTEPTARFKADGYIVYPDVENNNVIMSNRYLATTMGLEEWELLHALEKKNPVAAKSIAGSIASTFKHFNDEAEAVENARNMILTLLD